MTCDFFRRRDGEVISLASRRCWVFVAPLDAGTLSFYGTGDFGGNRKVILLYLSGKWESGFDCCILGRNILSI